MAFGTFSIFFIFGFVWLLGHFLFSLFGFIYGFWDIFLFSLFGFIREPVNECFFRVFKRPTPKAHVLRTRLFVACAVAALVSRILGD